MSDRPSGAPRRVLLAGDGSFLAHMSRLLEVGKVLRSRFGHTVVFAASGPYARLPREAGFPVEPLWTPDGAVTLDIVNRLGLVSARTMDDIVRKGVDADVDVLRRTKPDVVVGDMRWTMSVSADVARVPYAAIANGFWTRYRTTPAPVVETHPASRLLGARVASRLMPLAERPIAKWVALAYRNARRRHGLDPDGARDMYSIIEGRRTLIADIPEYAETRGAPASMRYVGPILWQMDWPGGKAPDWFTGLDPKRPLVYVTMGSTGLAWLFREAAEAFGKTRFQVVMTTAGLGGSLGAVPSNVHLVDYAPGTAIMARAAAVVCHGGNGTVNQAIVSGVPVLGIPGHVDQAINLDRVQEVGLGLRLFGGPGAGKRLVEAVERVAADPSYRRVAERLQAAAKRYGGPVQAAEELDRWVAEGCP